jgi:hypothetical protein
LNVIASDAQVFSALTRVRFGSCLGDVEARMPSRQIFGESEKSLPISER